MRAPAARVTLAAMEILALVIWLLVAGLGMVLLPVGITAPGAGLAALAAFGGVAAAILWIVLGAPLWTGWVQVGLALLGSIGGGFAAGQLMDDRNATGSGIEEAGAAALGLALPFYGTLLFVTFLLATGAVDPVV